MLARADEGRLALRREPIAVHDLLETVARRFGTQIDVAAPDGETIVGDRLRLEQALGNLVDNAQRHGGGTIRLEAERRDGRMELRVADEGNGFPAALLPHAFDRFTRGDEARAGGGAGLGLALVDAVARAHGGTARAANRDRMRRSRDARAARVAWTGHWRSRPRSCKRRLFHPQGDASSSVFPA